MFFFKHNIYKIVSSIIYIIVGIVLIFTDTFSSISNSSKQILGIIVIAYGVFRAFMAYRAFQNQND